jgi:hypothetical protein
MGVLPLTIQQHSSTAPAAAASNKQASTQPADKHKKAKVQWANFSILL